MRVELKKMMSLSLAVVLVLNLNLTIPVFAEESTSTETILDSVILSDNSITNERGEKEFSVNVDAPVKEATVSDLPSNDDMLEARIEQLTGTKKTTGIRRTVRRQTKLTGMDAKLYDALLQDIQEVAEGDRTSTEFYVNVSDLVDQMTYTDEELGFTLYDPDTATWNRDGAKAAVSSLFNYDFHKVMTALFADNPSLLYWYDLTSSVFYQAYPSYSMGYKNGMGTITLKDSIYFKWPVDVTYRTDTYETDMTKITAAEVAVNNAKAIAESAPSTSDYDKLKYFNDQICELTDYNHSAASLGTGYGDSNPWALIYVFDGDPDTKVVCEGYAEAFKYLCDLTTFKNDLNVYTVTGTMDGGTGAGAHEWDLVTMEDGSNYLVDPTNNDTGTVGQGDKLFLVGASSGSAAAGYQVTFTTIYGTSSTITYTYDSDTMSLYDTDELTMSNTDYEYVYVPDPTEITVQPVSQSAVKNSYVTLSVKASGSNLSYQWQYQQAGWKNWYTTSYAGNTTDTLRVQVTENGGDRYYRCVVTGDAGTETSEAALVSMKKVVITTQPVSQAVLKNAYTTLTIDATGTNLKYQWQYKQPGWKYWHNTGFEGKTTSSLKVQVTDNSGDRYYR